jgi:hypothetical protein
MAISLLLAAWAPPSIEPQEAFQAKELLQKDLHAYAGGDLVLSVGEITIAAGASGPDTVIPAQRSCMFSRALSKLNSRERQQKCIARERYFMKTRINFTLQQKT